MSTSTWLTTGGDRVEVYEATDGFRFRVVAPNGEIVGQGSEAYTRRYAAIDAAERHHPREVD